MKEFAKDKHVEQMKEYKEVFWVNDGYTGIYDDTEITEEMVREASDRLKRFAPYIMKAFPETVETGGIIESPLREIPEMKKYLENRYGISVPGKVFLKCDSHLAVSGSVKARGGIYEILKLAEKIALEEGLLREGDDYSVMAGEEFRKLFSGYKVAVGSTGNLGLSIGIISAELGFDVTVHMSADARQWKKDMLRSKGVTVVEYPDDYQKAVAEGRKTAADDPKCHFVDDESSKDLFCGYAVASERIKKQFEEQGIMPSEENPVFVYLPCGVGGAPGGVTYGLKKMFGDNIHCFFAEPTHAPCMMLGLVTGKHDEISCRDIGIDGKTNADGLAVGRPSPLVSNVMETLLEGAYTVDDAQLIPLAENLLELEEIYIEPSACAAFPGIKDIVLSDKYKDSAAKGTHVFWATGGSMVPLELRFED